LLPQQEDGQCFPAHIVKALDDYESEELDAQPECIRFLCSAKDGEFEEILSYSGLIDSFKSQEDGEENIWKFHWIMGHGEVTAEPLSIIAKDDPMMCVKCLYGYLSKMKAGVICIQTGEPDYSALSDQAFDWERSVNGNVSEMLPSDGPKLLGKYITLTHYDDTNLFHDIVAGHLLVTGILHLLNKTPIDWYSKNQAMVKTATYGSEFVAVRTCVDQIIDLSTTLHYLGVPVQDKSFVFGDNKMGGGSSTIPHAKFHKHHIALSLHCVQEAIAAKFIAMQHLDGIFNPADILHKHWAYLSDLAQP
jgi:hypothetical protein